MTTRLMSRIVVGVITISGAWAQPAATSLPLCVAAGFQQAFPYGPSVAVSDVDFAYASTVLPVDPANPFVFPHTVRSVVPGESVAFKGTFLDASSMQVLIQGRFLPLTQTWANPAEIGGTSRVTFQLPADIVADTDGTITISVIGQLPPAGACRAYNSPMKLTLAKVADAVYGYPVDSDHPVTSGFVSVFGADGTTTITVSGRSAEVVLLGTKAVGHSVANGIGEVRQSGALVATFPVAGAIGRSPSTAK